MSLYTERAFTKLDWDNLLKCIHYTHPEFVPSPEQVQEADRGINAGQCASAPVVGSYVFPLNVEITPGVPKTFDIVSSPEIAIRPKRFVANVPEAGLVTLDTITLDDFAMLVGSSDAYMFNHMMVGANLDLPTITKETKVRIRGAYTGVLAKDGKTPSLLAFAFMGPALIEKIEIFWKNPERHYSCDIWECDSTISLPLAGPNPEGWQILQFGSEDDEDGEQEGLKYVCPKHKAI